MKPEDGEPSGGVAGVEGEAADATRGSGGGVAGGSLGSAGAAGLVGGLGESLGGLIAEQLKPRLGPVRWFRTAWQRGGALTGHAVWDEPGAKGPCGAEAVVKVPVPPCERYWLTALQGEHGVVPRVFAEGASVGGYDFAWVVMERLPYGPISHGMHGGSGNGNDNANGAAAWGPAGLDVVIESLVTFHEATVAMEPAGAGRDGPPAGVTPRRSFAELLDRSRKAVSDGGLPEKQKWNALLKKAKKRIGQWQTAWDGRATDGWCHGDFHAGNVMSRSPAPDGPGVLIDFAQTRRGHWLEDAVYFEHQYWSVPEMLEGRQPTKMVVEGRRRLGLDLGHDWSELAAALRAWFAISAPLTLGRTHGHAHLDAAMLRLERLAAGQAA